MFWMMTKNTKNKLRKMFLSVEFKQEKEMKGSTCLIEYSI